MMKFPARILFTCLAACVCIALAQKTSTNESGNVIATLKQGQVKGKIMESDQGKAFNAFLGIPYGKVEKRFTSPKPADPWTGIHDGTKDGPACKQLDMHFRKGKHCQEDCLNINVYTSNVPASKNSSALLPVMAYIFGGGFVVGEASSTVHGPERLMDYPIVLALMNYRVGSFGFLSTHDEASPGNFGLLDQVLALEWIKDNIAVFGGDPDRVTIFGESAGGGSVAFHLLSPLSKGLFRGAIAQSGATLCPWSLRENPLNISRNIAEKLNCTTSNNREMVECLRQVDADVLLTAEVEASEIPETFRKSCGPVVEDPEKGGKFLTESPLKLLEEGKFNNVTVISGVTSCETAHWLSALQKHNKLPMPKNMQDSNLDEIINNLVNIHLEENVDPEAVKNVYFDNVDFSNKADIELRELELSTDLMFISCNDKTVKLLSAGEAPVYMYVFDHAPEGYSLTNYSGRPDPVHAIELKFLFNMKQSFKVNETEEAKRFGSRILDLWTNFAIYGDPTPSGPLDWTPTPPGTIKYLNITTNMAMVDGYLSKKMQFWDDHLYSKQEN